MVNFGLLAAEIGLPVWGTPQNFNGLRVLAALLHSSKVVSYCSNGVAIKLPILALDRGRLAAAHARLTFCQRL